MMSLERPQRTGRTGRPRRRRKPNGIRYASASFSLPKVPDLKTRRNNFLLAALVAAGTLSAALWPKKDLTKPEEDIFVMEEELPSPPPPEPPPPPPMQDPPPPRVEPPAPPPPPPPPQFGLEEGDLSETSYMAVAPGNTLMKEAEPEVAPPPPPLPPAPVFVDVAPRILKGDPPEYPARALDRGLEGSVIAVITIDTSGNVTQVDIEQGAGPDFDQAVKKVAAATRFQPPVRNGRKVPARFRAPFEFRLE